MLPWTLRRWLGLPDPDPTSQPVDPGAWVVPPEPVRPAHEAAVRADPTDRQALRAYAEVLRAALDARADLVLAMLDGQSADGWVADRPSLLGPLAGQAGVSVTWRYGFWQAVRIERTWDDGSVPALVRALLRDPAALVLEELGVFADTAAAVADAIADGDPCPLRRLTVDAGQGQLGTWEAAWPRLQHLEELTLIGFDPQLGVMSVPALRALVVDARLDDDNLRALTLAALPRLESLVLTVDPLPADSRIAELRARLPGARVDVGPRVNRR